MQYWRRRALRDAYFDKSVREAISDADARKFYDSQAGAVKPEEEVRARHILVDNRDKAREIYEKIAHGSDFAQLAKENSKDPGSKDQGGELASSSAGKWCRSSRRQPSSSEGRGQRAVREPVRLAYRQGRRPAAALAPAFEAVKDRVVASMIHKRLSRSRRT